MNISFMEFLETGRLGRIQLGSTAEEVLATLGQCALDDGALKNLKTKSHWQFGTFLISFGEEENRPDGVMSIEWNARLGEPRLPSGCHIEDWPITAEMKPLEVKSYLRRAGLKFNYRSSRG